MKNNCNWHTKRKYDECFAKVVIEEYFFGRYGYLQLQDKPDLLDVENNIGIEVVLAVDEKRNEAMALWAKMPEKTPKQQEGAKKRMLELGEKYQDGIMTWSPVDYPLDLHKSPLHRVVEVVIDKVDKLNDNQYKKCDRYDLFINSSIYIQSELLPSLFETIKGVNNKEKIYSFIYFYGQKTIVEFDFVHNKYTLKKDSRQADLVNMAWEMVEQGEGE